MSVILLPTRAAEEVCHEEQLRIWANDLVGAISMEGYLREDIDYAEGVEIEAMVMREIKKVVEAAFDHPAAVTIRRS